MFTNNKHYFYGIFFILLMFLISVIIRSGDFKNDRGIDNIQATYHSLLTMRSLESLPISESYLLPTITFNGDNNKNISWGATIPTKDGVYIYTSFPSLGFIIPYVSIRIIGANITLVNLFKFNLIISLLTAIIFYTSIFIFQSIDNSQKNKAMLAGIAGSSVFIFSCESLVSSGLIYWPQCISQVFLSLIILLFILREREPKNKNYDYFLFFPLLLLPLTEWTGYIFNCLIFIYFSFSRNEYKYRLLTIISASTLLSFSIYLFQLYLSIDLLQYIHTSINRFGARSIESANHVQFLTSYWHSFGLFLIFLVPLFILWKNNRNRLVFLLCLFPLVENIIMEQHATVFTFDRWKLAFLIGFCISLLFSYNKKTQYVTFLLIIISSIHGYHQYQNKLKKFSSWSDINYKNKVMIKKISKETNIECSDIFANFVVRAYVNLLFNNRGVYEGGIPERPLEVIEKNKSCSVIILKGNKVLPDLVEINSAEIYKKGSDKPIFIQ